MVLAVGPAKVASSILLEGFQYHAGRVCEGVLGGALTNGFPVINGGRNIKP